MKIPKIGNPFRGLTWKTIPAFILMLIYIGIGLSYLTAFKFADAMVFLMFGYGLYLYVKKIQFDNKGIWYEVPDFEKI